MQPRIGTGCPQFVPLRMRTVSPAERIPNLLRNPADIRAVRDPGRCVGIGDARPQLRQPRIETVGDERHTIRSVADERIIPVPRRQELTVKVRRQCEDDRTRRIAANCDGPNRRRTE